MFDILKDLNSQSRQYVIVKSKSSAMMGNIFPHGDSSSQLNFQE